MATWATFLNRNFWSIYGRSLGLFALNLQKDGDRVLGGDGFHGVLESVAEGLTAAGTNQATATKMTAMVNQFSTVAAGTGGALPVSEPGMTVTVAADGVSNLSVYSDPDDTGATIDGTAGSTAVTVTAGHRSVFKVIAAGKWISMGMTKSS